MNVLRAFESYVEDLSNWYVRNSRRRFWNGDEAALRTLWYSLVNALRLVAPIMPFLTEHLWQNLVRGAAGDAPASIFLAGWPELGEADEALLGDVAAMRHVVDLGRQARQASQLRGRQPLRRLVVEGAPRAESYAREIADELRVKEVSFGPVEASEMRVRPNLPVLGPRLGAQLGAIRQALASGDFAELADGGIRVAGHDLTADEVLVERTGKEGWAVASSDGVTVALDTALDDSLVREGRVNDLVHDVNTARKEAGLAIEDRVELWVPASAADLLEEYGEWIAAETLAVSVQVANDDQIVVKKA